MEPPLGDLSKKAILSATNLFVSTNGHRKVHSSATNVTCLVLEDNKENYQGNGGDTGLFSALCRKARGITELKSKKSASAMLPRSSMNSVKSTITFIAADGDGSPISPEIQTPELHQSTNDHHTLPREILHITRANSKPLSPFPITTHLPEGIFSADSPTPTHRPTTPADQRARFESTPQLAFCVSLLSNELLISTSESGSAEIPVLNERGRAWLSAIQEDLSAQAHIRGLLSKLVAEFVNAEFMEIATISEVVILGPVLCRGDYRTLLSSFIQRFDQTPLLDVDMLQGMIQLVQSASPGYLEDDDLVRILASLRMRLESTHAPSRAHVYQLVFAVSKVLEVMVIGEVKDLNRQRDHQSLLAALRGLRGVKDDVFLKFQVDYAHQTLLYLPDDETSWQAFLRYAESIAVGVSAAACVFKLDPMNALAAVEHLQQVAGNAIDVVKFNIEGARALQATAESAAQAGGRVYWSNKKEAWFLTLQTAYVLVRRGRLVEFNKLVCDTGCRFDINFQRGVCQLLGEIAANQLWDIASRRSAIDFLGELHKVKADRKKDVKIQKYIVSVLSRVSRMSWPDVSVYAGSLLADLQEDKIADTETDHPLHTCLPPPTSFPLLDRVLNIPEVEYDLDRMKFQRLHERLLPVFIPLRAKASLSALDSDFFPLMQRVQEFLESDRQVFLLLGDSGSGKSLFCRQLERVLWEQYEVGRRIPLFINLPSIDQPDNDLIDKHLRDHNNIPAHRVQEIKQHRQLVLICDGYDESRLTTNLHTTNKLNHLDTKMVISCRNTFLSHGYKGRFQPQGSDKYHDCSHYLFEEATIVPFSESDIQEFVTRYVMDPAVAAFLGNVPVPREDNYLEKLKVIPNVMNLAKNPFLLTLALKALPFLSIDILDQTQLEATKQNLYRGFTSEWIQLSKRRLERASLRQEVQDVYDELLEADFEWCVRDYSKRLAGAIYLHQRGRPVVEYTHRKDKESWKTEFFSPDIDPTLLREASPLARAGIQHWFIHKSLLDYFLSLAVFDPDDSNKGGLDGDYNDDSADGGGGDTQGGGGSSFSGGGGGLVDHGGKSTRGGYSGSSGGGGDSSGGGERSSDRSSNSSGGNGDSSGCNWDSIGERGGSSTGNGGSNGDGDDSQRRKDNARSKRKARLDKSRTCSDDIISKLNLFREPAVMQFLEERARSDVRFKKILSTTIEQSKSLVGPSLAAANAITILFKSGERFEDVDLDGVQVPSDYMLDETPDLVPWARSSLNGDGLVDALLVLAAPDNTQKATSTSTTVTSNSKTCNTRPDFPHQTVQYFSTTSHRQLTRHNTTVPQNIAVSPIEKNKLQHSAAHFEDYVKGPEKDQKRRTNHIQDNFSALPMSPDRNHDSQQQLISGPQRTLQMQQQALDRLAAMKGRIQAILRQTYELHEYLIPRLFIILPNDISEWNPVTLLNNRFQLYFLCECGEHSKVLSGDNTNSPHHIHIAKHEGYDLQRPTEFFQKYGRYMLSLLEMIKYESTIAGYHVPALSPVNVSRAIGSLTNSQDTITPSSVNQSIEFLQTLLSQQDATRDTSTDSFTRLSALKGADLRHLELFIKNKDQDRALGNLYRIITEEGLVKWVCINHYRLAHKDRDQQTFVAAVELNGGHFDPHLSRVSICLESKIRAAEFFDTLAMARHVDELVVTFDWEGTTSDLEAFGDTLENVAVSILRLDFRRFRTSLISEVQSTHSQQQALARYINLQSVKSIHIILPMDLIDLSSVQSKMLSSTPRLSFEMVSRRGGIEELGGRSFKRLVEILKTNSNLTILDLSCSSIGDNGAVALSKALKANSTLTSLHLSDNSVSDNGAVALSGALKINCTLTTLDLRSNLIGDYGAMALSEALKTTSTLTTLDLRSNWIGVNGAVALCEALETNSTLTTLHLSDNLVKDKGAVTLSEALKTNPTLTTKELRSNLIEGNGTMALSEALTANSTVTTLGLRSNKVRINRTVALSETLKTNLVPTTMALRRILLGRNGAMALSEALKTNPTLTTLNLRSKLIGVNGAMALSEALKTNTTLTSLDISGNLIRVNGAMALSEALKANSTLTSLDLRSNLIEVNGAVALSEALKTNSTLITLQLSDNSIKDDGTVALSEALKINCTLATLELKSNLIGDNGAMALSEALKANSTLTTLDLRSNLIKVNGAMALSEALKSNSTLTTLHLNDNSIKDGGAVALSEALKINCTMTTLDLWSNLSRNNGAMALSEARKTNSTLTTLGLDSDLTGWNGGSDIGDYNEFFSPLFAASPEEYAAGTPVSFPDMNQVPSLHSFDLGARIPVLSNPIYKECTQNPDYQSFVGSSAHQRQMEIENQLQMQGIENKLQMQQIEN